MEGFYPESSFLNYVRNMSEFVDNDKINLAEAGVAPDVLINNTTYPVKIETREDIPISIELDVFSTTNTIVRNAEAVELAYDKLESVLMGHRSILQYNCARKAAHSYAPDKDGDFTPVIEATGETAGDRKRLSFVDILALKERYEDFDIPLEDRYLVLNPKHVTDLLMEDVKTFKNLTDLQEGKPFNFGGFNILQYSKNPAYVKGEDGKWKKAAFGATGNLASFSFQAKEVMKADGSLVMFMRENDPEQRGTIVGFEKRFIAVPVRNKSLGAIVSPTVSTSTKA